MCLDLFDLVVCSIFIRCHTILFHFQRVTLVVVRWSSCQKVPYGRNACDIQYSILDACERTFGVQSNRGIIQRDVTPQQVYRVKYAFNGLTSSPVTDISRVLTIKGWLVRYGTFVWSIQSPSEVDGAARKQDSTIISNGKKQKQTELMPNDESQYSTAQDFCGKMEKCKFRYYCYIRWRNTTTRKAYQ